MSELIERAKEFLVQCGPCDFGLVEHGCQCPPGDPRLVIQDLVAELEKLRTEYAWVCEPPVPGGLPCLHRYSELTVREIVASGRGAVYVREVTDWRPEVPDA